MSKSSAAAAAWLGAAPVLSSGFAFANGEFFAEASGQNRHRRATPAELKTHFTSGSDKDHPAHWFEAQLIHYGLQPSKTKSVARMRLFDAVNAGSLAIPAHISKLEAQLKKEWTKNDREAKKASKSQAASASEPKKAAGAKRKADDVSVTINLTVSAGEISVQPTAKKTKTTATKTKSTAAAPAKKQTAATNAKSTAKAASTSRVKSEPTTPAPLPLRKNCARRGGISQGPGRGTTRSSPSLPPKFATKQTARRSSAFMARGRIPAPPSQPAYYDVKEESPPSYSDCYHERDDIDEDGGDELKPLGLLNGGYDGQCEYVTSQWSRYDESDFNLVLTLDGTSIWGSFNLGVIEGVLFFEERPWQSSYEPVPFTWRGREDEGPIMYQNRNHGWAKFLGDGRVEGWIDYQSISFVGRRYPGQGTRSGIDARSLRNEWEEYSEEAYEQERRSRWY